jgi:23S rRNA (cytidine1920-2'-O)/16S rRNA (cytidine1409-2'-O)-methyltransferase
MSEKKRLDLYLVDRGIAPTRTRAQSLIKEGKVLLNGKICRKAGEGVDDSAEISLCEPDHPYVSRGGVKLAAALDEFKISVAGKTILDVGSSTGGFTHCLLLRDVRKVYGIDVGAGQMAPEIQNDPRVTLFEGRNFRSFKPEEIPEPVDLIVVDLSFISLRLVIPLFAGFLKPNGHVVALIKPQFEAGPDHVNNRGVVTNQNIHARVLNEVAEAFRKDDFKILGQIESPIRGGEGNSEFLLYASR